MKLKPKLTKPKISLEDTQWIPALEKIVPKKDVDPVKKALESFDFEALSASSPSQGELRTLLATHILLNGNSAATTQIIADGLQGAWEFLKPTLNKKSFADKMVVFAKRNLTADKVLAG